GIRFPISVYQSSEYSGYTAAFDGVIRFYVQNLPIIIFNDVKCSDFSAVFQRITHNVLTPTFRAFLGNDQRVCYPFYRSLLCFAPQRQSGFFVNPVKTFMIDLFSLISQTEITLPKAFFWMIFT